MSLSKFTIEYDDPIKDGLIAACKIGDSNTIEELVNNLPINSQQFLNEALCYATALNLESVRCLLTSHNLNIRPDIHFSANSPLYNACHNTKIDIVEYLLTSSDLDTLANIHDNDDLIFRTLCGKQNYEMIEYLVCHYGIARTELIDNYLQKYPHPSVEHMFEMRAINKELNSSLDIKENTNKNNNKI